MTARVEATIEKLVCAACRWLASIADVLRARRILREMLPVGTRVEVTAACKFGCCPGRKGTIVRYEVDADDYFVRFDADPKAPHVLEGYLYRKDFRILPPEPPRE